MVLMLIFGPKCIGRVDPIPFSVKQDQTGLGKVTQDFRMIETTVSQRRNLDSERMQFETAAQRQQREVRRHTTLFCCLLLLT